MGCTVHHADALVFVSSPSNRQSAAIHMCYAEMLLLGSPDSLFLWLTVISQPHTAHMLN